MVLRVVLWFYVCGAAGVFSFGLKEEFTWSRINFAWPKSPVGGHRHYSHRLQTSEVHLRNVDYIYENNVPIGATHWKDKVFVTIPRRDPGIPSSLNYVSLSSPERHNVPLIPYPDWKTNQINTPLLGEERLVSVYRIAVDVCDRLWMADTGILEYPGNRTILQPHSVVIIDLKTDRIIKRHWLKQSVIKQATALTFMSVDVTPETCDDAYAYMPDLTGFGLVVYSLKADNSWRVRHNYFHLDPFAGDFDVAGYKYQWEDGTFSTTLSAVRPDGFRDMFFQSMAGTHIFKVSTSLLKNQTMATRIYHGDDFKIVANRKPGQQSTGTALHQPSGIMFLGLVNHNSIACWNTNRPFSASEFDVIFQDNNLFIYPTDVKVNEDEVMVLTNTMPVYIYGKLDYDQINFRVWINSVQNAVAGSTCEIKV